MTPVPRWQALLHSLSGHDNLIDIVTAHIRDLEVELLRVAMPVETDGAFGPPGPAIICRWCGALLGFPGQMRLLEPRHTATCFAVVKLGLQARP